MCQGGCHSCLHSLPVLLTLQFEPCSGGSFSSPFFFLLGLHTSWVCSLRGLLLLLLLLLWPLTADRGRAPPGSHTLQDLRRCLAIFLTVTTLPQNWQLTLLPTPSPPSPPTSPTPSAPPAVLSPFPPSPLHSPLPSPSAPLPPALQDRT